jgi:hypothetical protein
VQDQHQFVSTHAGPLRCGCPTSSILIQITRYSIEARSVIPGRAPGKDAGRRPPGALGIRRRCVAHRSPEEHPGCPAEPQRNYWERPVGPGSMKSAFAAALLRRDSLHLACPAVACAHRRGKRAKAGAEAGIRQGQCRRNLPELLWSQRLRRPAWSSRVSSSPRGCRGDSDWCVCYTRSSGRMLAQAGPDPREGRFTAGALITLAHGLQLQAGPRQ